MKKAVITTGGKQYLVEEGQQLKVEKLPSKTGDNISFKEVLLTITDKTTKIGQPRVTKATVEAKVIGHKKAKKITGVKMKPKKRNRHFYGHRQPFTEIEIKKIKTT
jgi:large subunit ribosomal protein L21